MIIDVVDTDAMSGEYPLIPEKEVVEIRVTDITSRESNFGLRLDWHFEVVEEGEYKGISVKGSTGAKFTLHSECRLYNWAKSLTGDDYESGQSFDTDDMIGLVGRGIVSHRRDNQDRVWMNISDVLPARRPITQAPDVEPF